MIALRRRMAFCSVFLAVGGLCAVGVRAQSPDTATGRGDVQDQSHAPVADAEVTLTNTLSGLKRQAHTDDSGSFSVAGLPVAGHYDISVHKQGFAEAKLAAVTLAGGTTASVRLQLNVAAGKEEMGVPGTGGSVRTEEPQLGDHLSATQAEETPLLNRRITYLPLLDAANRPAINQGDVFMNEDLFTTNGTGRRQTWFEVDGNNGVDAWGRQTIFTNVPLDAVEEMTILSNAFSAEYGFTAGSVVNIVTKSGGQNFHGDVLGLSRPADTSASLSGFTPGTASSGNDVASDSLWQTAGSLSGPIGSNGRTQFFASGEYISENRGSPITSPLEPGIFVGHYRGWLAPLPIYPQINR